MEEERGRQQELSLSARLVGFRRSYCWLVEEGKAHRSPPNMISEFKTLPTKDFKDKWKASLSAIFMVLKFVVPLVREIMTGAILGGGVELRVP